MVSGTTTTERVSLVDAKRLWNAMVKDAHNFFPRAFPEVFSSVIFVGGDGGAGTIKQVNFTPANKQFSFINERVDEIDEEKFVYKFTVMEGGALGDKLISLSIEVKLVDREEGGCVITTIANYETLPDAQFDEGRVKQMNENMNTMSRKTEQYLISNPSLYC